MTLTEKIQYKKEKEKERKKIFLSQRSDLDKAREQYNYITDLMIKPSDYWSKRSQARNKVKEEFKKQKTDKMSKLPSIKNN